jgi:actin-related protein
MTDLWEYALRDLMGVDPASADILIIDSSYNSKKYKAHIIEKIFEKLKAQSVLVMNSSVLSLFSVGATMYLFCYAVASSLKLDTEPRLQFLSMKASSSIMPSKNRTSLVKKSLRSYRHS